jgi:REP element-mobilizing transposase RayT
MDDQSKKHAKFLILSHVIFVWKYRNKLLISDGNEVKQVFEESAARSDCSCETCRAWIKTIFIARLRAKLVFHHWPLCAN